MHVSIDMISQLSHVDLDCTYHQRLVISARENLYVVYYIEQFIVLSLGVFIIVIWHLISFSNELIMVYMIPFVYILIWFE